MDAPNEAALEMKIAAAPFDFEAAFRAHYERIARVIGRVVRDPARAEELTVEVFLKLWRSPKAHGEKADGWLYRTAVRAAIDELRSQTRRAKFERLLGFVRPTPAPTPEDVRSAAEDQDRVRLVLGSIDRRHTELLLLRSHGFSYEEVAAALDLNPASVGTFLIRAQQTFRKEYVNRYGEQ